MNIYRRNLERQVNEYSYKYCKKAAISTFKATILKYASIITSILGLIIIYNVDINLINRIFLTIVLLLINVTNFIASEIFLMINEKEYNEIEASQYYVDNIDKFKYYLDKEVRYVVPIEEIARYNLTKKDLENVIQVVDEFKEEYDDLGEIKLTYKNLKSEKASN